MLRGQDRADEQYQSGATPSIMPTQAAIVAATAAIDKATASANELSNPIAQFTAGTAKAARDNC